MKLRYINSASLAGDFNMACDYSLATIITAKESAVLRFYTWIKPTISIGYHQKIEDIDLDRCLAEGIDVVKRPTGGRAILHDGEITYCFITAVEEGEKRKALKDIYRKVHAGISRAVMQRGIQADLSPGRKTTERHHPICFASSASSELSLNGKKVVGSAQRLINSTVLQHGSILLTPAHLKLPDYLNLDPEKRIKLRQSLEQSSTHIPLKDTAELRLGIAESIANIFESKIDKSSLTNDEKEQIIKNKYKFTIIHSLEEL